MAPKKTSAAAVVAPEKPKRATKSSQAKSSQEKPSKSECCKGTTSCSTTKTTTSRPLLAAAARMHEIEHKQGRKTRVVVKYDVGFSNVLHIRGSGANLSWHKGTPLKNVKKDEWVWETDSSFAACEFKVLVNDAQYETGNNHLLTCGASIEYTPRF